MPRGVEDPGRSFASWVARWNNGSVCTSALKQIRRSNTPQTIRYDSTIVVRNTDPPFPASARLRTQPRVTPSATHISPPANTLSCHRTPRPSLPSHPKRISGPAFTRGSSPRHHPSHPLPTTRSSPGRHAFIGPVSTHRRLHIPPAGSWRNTGPRSGVKTMVPAHSGSDPCTQSPSPSDKNRQPKPGWGPRRRRGKGRPMPHVYAHVHDPMSD